MMNAEEDRKRFLNKIIKSDSTKKLIVAGPGTGKTYTFGRVLECEDSDSNIAMTFIRKLVEDMAKELTNTATISTFHKYCKETLHHRLGSFKLLPYLPRLIESDASLMGLGFTGFSERFQLLQTDCKEVAYYLDRSNYYSAISFDDSVYRLLEEASDNPDVLPDFNLLVVDEFQDFNPLEVALIDLLEKKGKILIVGDDDQAVYDSLRNASPIHLRNKFHSGDYETFSLPYCSRCTDVVVQSVSAVVSKASETELIKGRIDKPFNCYLPDKQADSDMYPKVVAIRCTTVSVVGKYVTKAIESIPQNDVMESNRPGHEYFTALVIGPHHYLRSAEKIIRQKFDRLTYSPSKEDAVLIEDAFELLAQDNESNLGWRIILECCSDGQDLCGILDKSAQGARLIDLIDQRFMDSIHKALGILEKVKTQVELDPFEDRYLKDLIESDYDRVIDHFSPKEEEADPDFEESDPTVCLTTYVGCKGLSAGHVFILGMNEGDLPRTNTNITDAEVCRFLVGMTRTRKQCHLVSNKWLISPYGSKGYITPFARSVFVNWIPTGLLADFGNTKTNDLDSLFK